MHDLLRIKVRMLLRFCIFSIILLITQKSGAQFLLDGFNQPDHNSKFYHIGISLDYNNSHFQVSAHPSFLQSDSVMYVNPKNTGGFGLAGIHTLHFSPHWEARIVFPQLMFAYKQLEYSITYPQSGEKPIATKEVESILLGFPVEVKFLSDRIGNFRIYMLGGLNYQYDLASNATSRKAQDLVKLKPYDFSIEAGVGCQIFFPFVIVSPELKISDGLINVHSRDPNLIYSSVIDKLNSRMVVFSLILEG